MGAYTFYQIVYFEVLFWSFSSNFPPLGKFSPTLDLIYTGLSTIKKLIKRFYYVKPPYKCLGSTEPSKKSWSKLVPVQLDEMIQS